jgi:hypothetical protein
MKFTTKKAVKKVSSLRKQSSTKAFPHRGAGGSLRRGVSHGEARGRAKTLPFVSQFFTGETNKEPFFYLSYLEGAIHDLIEGGYLKALRRALKEYRQLCLEIAKGGLCKK